MKILGRKWIVVCLLFVLTAVCILWFLLWANNRHVAYVSFYEGDQFVGKASFVIEKDKIDAISEKFEDILRENNSHQFSIKFDIWYGHDHYMITVVNSFEIQYDEGVATFVKINMDETRTLESIKECDSFEELVTDSREYIESKTMDFRNEVNDPKWLNADY